MDDIVVNERHAAAIVKRRPYRYRPRPSLALLRRLAVTVAIFLPTIATLVYYGFVCTDRYVSEARFIVRNASKPGAELSGLASMLQLAGLSSAQDDSYSVRDYLLSRDALRELGQTIDVRRVYSDPRADLLSRYDTFLRDRSVESLYRYFERWLTVVVNNTSKVIVLRVETFDAKDSKDIAERLIELGEQFVNRMNDRMEADAVRVSTSEVARAEKRMVDAQVALTAFRNRELILDPGKSAAIVVELVGKLSGELAETRAQIDEMKRSSPNSHSLELLAQRASAIEAQIAAERAKTANDSDGLADKIADYERLMFEQQFATHALGQARAALESARIEARRQQLFLERVVEPSEPDKAMEPRRWQIILTVFGFNVIGIGVIWMTSAGWSEHAAHRR